MDGYRLGSILCWLTPRTFLGSVSHWKQVPLLTYTSIALLMPGTERALGTREARLALAELQAAVRKYRTRVQETEGQQEAENDKPCPQANPSLSLDCR